MQEGLARSRYHVNAKIAISIKNVAQKLQFDLLWVAQKLHLDYKYLYLV